MVRSKGGGDEWSEVKEEGSGQKQGRGGSGQKQGKGEGVVRRKGEGGSGEK